MNQRRRGLVRITGQKMYDQADAAWEAEMRKKLGQDKKDKVHAASRARGAPLIVTGVNEFIRLRADPPTDAR